jgi:hypothetical protein
MSRSYIIYYSCLGILTFGVALYTVVVGSQHIDYGQRVSLLEQQKKSLSARALQVEQQTAQELSMSKLNYDAQTLGFVPIQRIVRVDTSTVVASR